MQALSTITAASLLAFAAPAFAQTYDPSHASPRHHSAHPPRVGYQIRGRENAQSRYGSGDVYVREGRAAAPATTPGFAWRPGSQQEGVGADLVGPGSAAENPTGQHDVSR